MACPQKMASIIPYSVLQENRERARKAEEELAETKRRIAELEAKAGAAQSEGVKRGNRRTSKLGRLVCRGIGNSKGRFSHHA